jgi:hypothetical protein
MGNSRAVGERCPGRQTWHRSRVSVRSQRPKHAYKVVLRGESRRLDQGKSKNLNGRSDEVALVGEITKKSVRREPAFLNRAHERMNLHGIPGDAVRFPEHFVE